MPKISKTLSVYVFSLDRLIGDTSKIPTLIDHCLISNREGLGTSLGLATTLIHLVIKCRSSFTKALQIPQFGVNRPNSKQDTAI